MAAFAAVRVLCLVIGFALGWALWTYLAAALPASRLKLEEQARLRGRPAPALPGDLFAAAAAPLPLRVTAYAVYLAVLVAFVAPVLPTAARLSQTVAYVALAVMLAATAARRRGAGGAAPPPWLAACQEAALGAFALAMASGLLRFGLARQQFGSVAFGALIVGLSLSRVTWALFVGRERPAVRS